MNIIKEIVLLASILQIGFTQNFPNKDILGKTFKVIVNEDVNSLPPPLNIEYGNQLRLIYKKDAYIVRDFKFPARKQLPKKPFRQEINFTDKDGSIVEKMDGVINFINDGNMYEVKPEKTTNCVLSGNYKISFVFVLCSSSENNMNKLYVFNTENPQFISIDNNDRVETQEVDFEKEVKAIAINDKTGNIALALANGGNTWKFMVLEYVQGDSVETTTVQNTTPSIITSTVSISTQKQTVTIPNIINTNKQTTDATTTESAMSIYIKDIDNIRSSVDFQKKIDEFQNVLEDVKNSLFLIHRRNVNENVKTLLDNVKELKMKLGILNRACFGQTSTSTKTDLNEAHFKDFNDTVDQNQNKLMMEYEKNVIASMSDSDRIEETHNKLMSAKTMCLTRLRYFTENRNPILGSRFGADTSANGIENLIAAATITENESDYVCARNDDVLRLNNQG